MKDKNFTIGAGLVFFLFVLLQVTKPDLYISDRGLLLFLILFFGGILQFSTRQALRGGEVFLRSIPAVKAVEEAVGRSTEMGKPVLFVPGIQDMNQVETVAGVVILGHVSKMTARYETPLNVPVARSIVLKAAQSLDGKIALKNGASSWISNSQSRKDTHLMRAQMKAILVGKNTAVNDNPALTVRLSHKELGLANSLPIPQPTKIIIGDIKKASEAKKIFANNAKVITGSRKSGFVKNNVEHLQYKNKNFLNAFMADLLARDISSVLVEGGQETLNAFISNNLFDELVLYTAPIVLGKKSLSTVNLESPLLIKEATRLKLHRLEKFDADVKATYFA